MSSATFAGDDFAGRPPLRAVPDPTKNRMAFLLAARDAARRMANRIAAATRGAAHWLRTAADTVHLTTASSTVWRASWWLLSQGRRLVCDAGGTTTVAVLLATSDTGSRLLRTGSGRLAAGYRWLATRFWMGVDGLLSRTGKTGTALADKLAWTRLTTRTTLRSWAASAKRLLGQVLPSGRWARTTTHAAASYHAACSLIRRRVPAGWQPFAFLLALLQLALVGIPGRSWPRLRSVIHRPARRTRPAPTVASPVTPLAPEEPADTTTTASPVDLLDEHPAPEQPDWLADPHEQLPLEDPALLLPPGNREARREAARPNRNRSRRR